MVALLLIRMVRQRQRQYGLLSLVGLGMGSALWSSAPLLTTRPGWLLALGTGLLVAGLVVRLGRRSRSSRYRLVSLIGIGVGLGIVLWRMTGALARVGFAPTPRAAEWWDLAFFANVLGLGAWCGRRWEGVGLPRPGSLGGGGGWV